MPSVTYISADGAAVTVDVPAGHSVMEGAIRNGIDGIEADCGGCCSCATCHVFVDAEWFELTGRRKADEQGMLECTVEPPRETSRLSCQIKVTEALDGLVVYLPAAQS